MDGRFPTLSVSLPAIDGPALAVDTAAIVGLVVVGLVSHGVNPLLRPLYAIDTVFPFVAGWLLCAGLLGLYRDRRTEFVVAHLRSVTVCWLAAANVAFLIRGSPVTSGGIAWTFTVVLTGLGLVVVLGSRTAFDRRFRLDDDRL